MASTAKCVYLATSCHSRRFKTFYCLVFQNRQFFNRWSPYAKADLGRLGYNISFCASIYKYTLKRENIGNKAVPYEYLAIA